jgi:putative peptidoglycan lipid II flippase
LTATIFGYGEFGPRDIEMTRYALMAYSWGLIGFSLVKVLAPGYFARQDTRTPVRIGLISLAVNMSLNLAVVLPAHYAGFATPFVLLATSTCVSAAVNAALLWRGLRQQGVYQPAPGWLRLSLQVSLATLAMVAVILVLDGPLEAWVAASLSQRMVHLAVCIAAGVVVYAAVLWLVGLRPSALRTREGAARL